MSTQPRGAELYVSFALKWKLQRLAKVNDNTADGFAEKILDEWIAAHAPKLDSLWADRQAIDGQAETELGAKKLPF